MKRRPKILRRKSNFLVVSRSYNWNSFYTFSNCNKYLNYPYLTKLKNRSLISTSLNTLTSSGSGFITKVGGFLSFNHINHTPKKLNNGMVSFSLCHKTTSLYFFNMYTNLKYKKRRFSRGNLYHFIFKWNYILKKGVSYPSEGWFYLYLKYSNKPYKSRPNQLIRHILWRHKWRYSSYWTYHKIYTNRDIKARIAHNTNLNFPLHVKGNYNSLI